MTDILFWVFIGAPLIVGGGATVIGLYALAWSGFKEKRAFRRALKREQSRGSEDTT